LIRDWAKAWAGQAHHRLMSPSMRAAETRRNTGVIICVIGFDHAKSMPQPG
jgi:hypothetical protein